MKSRNAWKNRPLTTSKLSTNTIAMSDCAADGGKVWVAGGCVPVVCPAGKRFCQRLEVRTCNAKGDASTLFQACASTQICDTVTPSCKSRLCTPNQPACSGNVRTTCNADGSGYVPGGTDCTPQYCAAGACASVLHRETFEDGTHTRFTGGPGNYGISGSSTPGADGTTYTLMMYKAATGTVPDGLSYTFASPVQPRSISYWVKVNSTLITGLGYFRLLSASEVLFYSYFGNSYLYALWAVSYSYIVDNNTWYHVELRNIDWTARTGIQTRNVTTLPAVTDGEPTATRWLPAAPLKLTASARAPANFCTVEVATP